MPLHDSDGLILEGKTAAESLPDPTLVPGRSHWLAATTFFVGSSTWSSAGPPLPFFENGVSVATITVSPGEVKTAYSDGVQWIITTGVITTVPPTIQSAQHANAGTFTLAAAAHAATGGWVWLLNPVGSGVILDVRRVWTNFAPGATAVLTPGTTITVERMTFTGVPAGPAVVPAPRDTADPAAVGTIRTSTAGIVPTAGPVAHAMTAQQMVGAIGLNLTNSVPIDQTFPSEIDTNSHIVLRPGQGIVVRQSTAGAALLENRTIRVDFEWDERI